MSGKEKTYLERPPEGNRLLRFYETTVSGKKLTIRYGRVGGVALSYSRTYPSGESARRDSARRIRRRLHKGYEQPGATSARTAKPSQSTRKLLAPVLWRFDSGDSAFGIFIDDNRCWVGNEGHKVFALDHAGNVVSHFQFPDSVMALVGDEAWMYAGCDDGNVYDLGGSVPRLAYEMAGDAAIDWIDIRGGVVAVSNMKGAVVAVDVESRPLWKHKSSKSGGYMARCDREVVYHGHWTGVTAYALDGGKKLWFRKTPSVLFGWQTEAAIYVGTMENTILRLNKKDGRLHTTFACDETVFSCAATADDTLVFGGDDAGFLYSFDAKGNRLWKLQTGCGDALSMQSHQGKLYLATLDGYLACVDVSPAAIQAAFAGSVPQVREIKAPGSKAARPTSQLETTRNAGKGVVLECVREGTHLRMHVVSAGYHKDWHVQFPRDVREEGARYVVDEVREATRGGFYRAYGSIKRLEQGAGRRRR